MATMKSTAKKEALRRRVKRKPDLRPFKERGRIDPKTGEYKEKVTDPEERAKLDARNKQLADAKKLRDARTVSPDLDFKMSPKQMAFIATSQDPKWGFPDEVLYGGAAGGGKTWCQVIDAFLYATHYVGSTQLILRRSFPELKRSIIMEWLRLVPDRFATYNTTDHMAFFKCGSTVEFGYLESDESVTIYKSAQYDVIRFEEAGEFTAYQLTYMKSRIRGTNPNFPKQVKCTTNPSGPGMKQLKKEFQIGVEPPLTIFKASVGIHPVTKIEMFVKRVFIPAMVWENKAVMEADPLYISRLMQLPEKEREALLNGNWDVLDDQAFSEFSRPIHVCETFPIPEHWKRWRSVDNGYNDPFAWYWFAVSEDGIIYVYREYTRNPEIQKDKILYSDQARKVKMLSSPFDLDTLHEKPEKIAYTVAGHDAWNTFDSRDVKGKTIVDHYEEGGLYGFAKAITDRRARAAVIHEYLKPFKGHDGRLTAKIQIMDCCPILISMIPEQLIDPNDNEKYAESELDHQVDAFGYGILSYHATKSKPLPVADNRIHMHKVKYARMLANR